MKRYDRLHLLYLKQVSCSQRSNVGTIYINGSFNRGAMNKLYCTLLGILYLIDAILLIVGTIALFPIGLASQIVLSFISAIMIVASIACFLGSSTKQQKTYDPYDISDMD